MICSLPSQSIDVSREFGTQNNVFAPFHIACRIAKSHTKDLKPNVAVNGFCSGCNFGPHGSSRPAARVCEHTHEREVARKHSCFKCFEAPATRAASRSQSMKRVCVSSR